MSLPKKGSRIIEIESGSYRWMVRKKPTYSEALAWGTMIVAIESIQENARGILLVDTGIYRPDNWIHPNKTSVTPKVIREMIQAAIADGWEPLTSGTHRLKYQLITDRI